MPFANRLCLTEIDSVPEQADAFFPAVDLSEWTEVSREFHDTDEKHDYKYCFVDYVK
jgi:dihydrofolate reductase